MRGSDATRGPETGRLGFCSSNPSGDSAMTAGNDKGYAHEAHKGLAVVIPAYKARFLKATLTSLVAQTDKRFRVYVGDDSSPDDISKLSDQFSSDLDLVYRRFDEHLGAKSLVRHWNRCVELSSEPWVWLLSDDDVVDSECVKAFYQALSTTGGKYQVYRFNTLTIDADGKVTRINPPHPRWESGIQFAYHRLMSDRASFVSEYIFSRSAFDREGGFVEFPIAWCSDDASWISFSGEDGIYTIDGPRVHWRASGSNITRASAVYKEQKIEAVIQYIDWLNGWISCTRLGELRLDNELLSQCMKRWFHKQLLCLEAPLSLRECLHLARRMDVRWNDGFIKNLFKLIRVDIQFFSNRISSLPVSVLKRALRG